MKVIHLISGGDSGGAKTHVLSLLQHLNETITAQLVCFRDGPFAEEARAMGIPTMICGGNNIPHLRRELAVPYDVGRPFPLTALFCFAHIRRIHGRSYAIFAFNDLTALVALGRCQRRGLRVPEDIGICGYDDIASAATAHPSLTTVAVEKEALGREAVTWLLDATGTTLKSVHPVRLVIRESSLGPQAR